MLAGRNHLDKGLEARDSLSGLESMTSPLVCNLSPNSLVPNLFGTRDCFHGRQLFSGPGCRGWLWDDPNTLHLLYFNLMPLLT